MKFNPYPKTITAKKPKKFLNRSRKPTGELPVFKEIMRDKLTKEGKLYSEISGEEIQNASQMNFHHILPKLQYPGFRLEKKNIIVVTDDEHFLIHNGSIKELRLNPLWKNYFEKVEQLKEEYKNGS